MGVRNTADDARVALYDSVTGFAFGPTFTTVQEARLFEKWATTVYPHLGDLRKWNDRELEGAYLSWALIFLHGRPAFEALAGDNDAYRNHQGEEWDKLED